MANLKTIKLESELLSHVIEISHTKKYSTESPLFYEGQIPVVAYLIVDGAIQLLKKKKIKYTIKAGNIIGIDELLKNIPSKLSAKALAETTLCFLDKSTLKEILNDPHSHLSKALNNGEVL